MVERSFQIVAKDVSPSQPYISTLRHISLYQCFGSSRTYRAMKGVGASLYLAEFMSKFAVSSLKYQTEGVNKILTGH